MFVNVCLNTAGMLRLPGYKHGVVHGVAMLPAEGVNVQQT